MLHILFGEDDYSIHEVLGELERTIGDESLLASNTTELDAQASLDDLMRACETVPFLAPKRLVIVRGLLGRFEVKTRQAAGKAKPTQNSDQLKSFVSYIDKLRPSAELVLIDGEISPSNPLLRALSGRGDVREFRPLGGEKLRDWVYKQVARTGGSISPRAADALVSLIGGDLWTMSNEIAKLALFAAGRRIEEDDLKKLVSSTRETSVFAMVDAVLERKPALAQRSLQSLLEDGAAPPYILVMLTRQLRLIVRAKELKRLGKGEAEIQSRLGVRDFALRKTLEQASRYSWEPLKMIYEKLVEADLAVKTGRYEPELALNILVAELSQPAL